MSDRHYDKKSGTANIAGTLLVNRDVLAKKTQMFATNVMPEPNISLFGKAGMESSSRDKRDFCF